MYKNSMQEGNYFHIPKISSLPDSVSKTLPREVNIDDKARVLWVHVPRKQLARQSTKQKIDGSQINLIQTLQKHFNRKISQHPATNQPKISKSSKRNTPKNLFFSDSSITKSPKMKRTTHTKRSIELRAAHGDHTPPSLVQLITFDPSPNTQTYLLHPSRDPTPPPRP